MTRRVQDTQRLPKLPKLMERKLYKTGQTRGADDDEIYQNRVARNSTVLIPLAYWEMCRIVTYESGYIVLLSSQEYFSNPNITDDLAARGLTLGANALVFYETREQWNANNPDALGWTAAERRTPPFGGQYVARIPATTAAADGNRIVRGFDRTSQKGAGIRVYEYAAGSTIKECRLQLEALFWSCIDADDVAVSNGMTTEAAAARKAAILQQCRDQGLLDIARLVQVRAMNARGKTICPLCLEEFSSKGFFTRMAQAEGRLVLDLTVTEVNLFHISELRVGVSNHVPYNVGWGHHHCNVVVRDAGILPTLKWMQAVVARNLRAGHLPVENSDI